MRRIDRIATNGIELRQIRGEVRPDTSINNLAGMAEPPEGFVVCSAPILVSDETTDCRIRDRSPWRDSALD